MHWYFQSLVASVYLIVLTLFGLFVDRCDHYMVYENSRSPTQAETEHYECHIMNKHGAYTSLLIDAEDQSKTVSSFNLQHFQPFLKQSTTKQINFDTVKSACRQLTINLCTRCQICRCVTCRSAEADGIPNWGITLRGSVPLFDSDDCRRLPGEGCVTGWLVWLELNDEDNICAAYGHQIVVLMLGGNDLDNGCSEYQLADRVIHKANSMILHYTESVVITSLWPRASQE